ncbi:hypothetical protein Rhe02_14660 [Rhizocola hellebori]|uniref:Pentapeptide repeat-containing protein n=2 Tax=Rhizocola hellebori TaxID=1392758 RepID=A0A8J3VDA8_9ACTN|nr:hypothetical protein Rhe02_14660 [Rhizocola hellebori]
MVLLGVWDTSVTVTDADRMRLDRIKTGLTMAAGLAAGATLLMALRRQSLSERAQRFAESDALEQRTTALYVAAADQLASEKAAVRLAGLYSLERLGQDNPKLRQTVFNVWCAYLRMPYTPPLEVLRRNAESSPSRPAEDAPLPEPKEGAERRQELEVRRTAQRLLAAHVSIDGDGAPLDGYWLSERGLLLSIDLTAAELVDFTLGHCVLGDTILDEAQFHDITDLREAQFYGVAGLGEAQFHGVVLLSEAQFHDKADLHGTQFHDKAFLRRAHFHSVADLSGTQFHDIADLGEAQFHGNADLRGAEFYGMASLGQAQFHGNADLGEVQRITLEGVHASPRATLPSGWVLSSKLGKNSLFVVTRTGEDRPPAGSREDAEAPTSIA